MVSLREASNNVPVMAMEEVVTEELYEKVRVAIENDNKRELERLGKELDGKLHKEHILLKRITAGLRDLIDLSMYYKMRQEEAARCLGMSAPSLSRRYRKEAGRRWPTNDLSKSEKRVREAMCSVNSFARERPGDEIPPYLERELSDALTEQDRLMTPVYANRLQFTQTRA